VFAAAATDIDKARARRDQATAALYPTVSLSATSQKYQSTQKWREDNAEVYGTLEVAQPIYDFGKSAAEIDASGSDVAAAEQAMIAARNAVLMEGLAVFYNLHASEVKLRADYEAHTSVYVRWETAKERLVLGTANPMEVAEWLTKVEKTRLIYRREQSRNTHLRLRLEELTGATFDDELVAPPPPPKEKPFDVDREDFANAVMARNPGILALIKKAEATGMRRDGVGSLPSLQAFANVGHYSRDMRGRNEYAYGARLSWPIFDGGINSAKRSQLAADERRLNAQIATKKGALRLAAHDLILARDDSFQHVISALADKDFNDRQLLYRQQLYMQNRVSDLGPAMGRSTASDAELIRATGSYYVNLAKIAVILGEHPAEGLKPNFLTRMTGQTGLPTDQFVPKAGSGFGQDDQNTLNRNPNKPK
ncbi:MAG: TolC family protein, partial [Rhodospirillaceae bacterium]|nr:TolC family protein [Rhodospirillaceae bacterium]